MSLGIVLALLAGVLVFAVTQGTTAEKPVEETVSVVVAKVDIPERTVLTAAQLETRQYPKTIAPTGYIGSIDAAVRLTTLSKVPIGGPILASQVVTGGGATGISLTLERGKVLVAFPAADALTSAGQLKVGDRVDILATITPPALTPAPAPTGAGAPIPTPVAAPVPTTQTIVQNVEIVDIPVKGVLLFIVDHQTSLVLKSLRDGGAVIDIAIRSRAETDTIKTEPVDRDYIVKTFGLR